jgi:hypothetical protein
MSDLNKLNLICEYYAPDITDLSVLEEGVGVDKSMFLQGIFLQGNKKNRNGRNYPTPMLEGSVKKYIDSRVKTRRSIGELNHPQGVELNLDRISHIITELNMKGDDGYGKAKLLNTPCGLIAQELIKGGVQLGVSTRGLGKLGNETGMNEGKEVSDFELITVDIVSDPSAPDAFVQGVMESAQYVLDCQGGICKVKDDNQIQRVEEAVGELKKDMISIPKREPVKYEYETVMKFLNNL